MKYSIALFALCAIWTTARALTIIGPSEVELTEGEPFEITLTTDSGSDEVVWGIYDDYGWLQYRGFEFDELSTYNYTGESLRLFGEPYGSNRGVIKVYATLNDVRVVHEIEVDITPLDGPKLYLWLNGDLINSYKNLGYIPIDRNFHAPGALLYQRIDVKAERLGSVSTYSIAGYPHEIEVEVTPRSDYTNIQLTGPWDEVGEHELILTVVGSLATKSITIPIVIYPNEPIAESYRYGEVGDVYVVNAGNSINQRISFRLDGYYSDLLGRDLDSIEAESYPDGLTFTSHNSFISIGGRVGEPGLYEIPIVATYVSWTGTHVWKLRVLDTPVAPIPSSTSAWEITVGVQEQREISFENPEGVESDITVEVLSELPSFAQAEVSGTNVRLTARSISDDDIGNHTVTLKATNDFGSTTVNLDLEVVAHDGPNGAAPIAYGEAELVYPFGIQTLHKIEFDNPEGVNSAITIELVGELPAFMQADIEGNQVKLSGRALARSDVGSYTVTLRATNDIGSTEVEVTTVVISDEDPLPFVALGPELSEFQTGFAYSPWFGFVFIANAPWVYNYELGWFYIHESTTSNEEVWMYHVGNPDMGWMFSGSGLSGFFYYELTPGNWDWQWLYTGVVDLSTPDDPPANP